MSTLFKHLSILMISLLSITQVFSQAYIGDEKEIQAILKNVTQFSKDYMNGNAEGIANAYTADGKIFPSNVEVIEGRDALIKYWTMPEGIKVKFHRVSPVEIFIQGDRADDWGYYEGITIGKDGKESAWKGKYVIVWKKINGEWKIYLDIWNRIEMEKE